MAMTRQVEPAERGQSAAAMDLSRSAIARYIQLATLFRRRIQCGQWKLHDQIPTVEDLVEECGVARATVRQALGVLEKEGLIERFRAKGTFVTKRPEDDLWCPVHTDWDELIASHIETDIDVLANEANQQPPILPHAIGEPAPSYRHLRRRHRRDDRAFLLADVYIDERLCARIPAAGLRSKLALRLITDLGVEFVDVRQTLTIGAADVETARDLDIPLNAPVAHLHRSAVDRAGCLVIVGEGIYRGDVLRLDQKLR
jgi:GntR family transcriptional regulator